MDTHTARDQGLTWCYRAVTQPTSASWIAPCQRVGQYPAPVFHQSVWTRSTRSDTFGHATCTGLGTHLMLARCSSAPDFVDDQHLPVRRSVPRPSVPPERLDTFGHVWTQGQINDTEHTGVRNQHSMIRNEHTVRMTPRSPPGVT